MIKCKTDNCDNEVTCISGMCWSCHNKMISGETSITTINFPFTVTATVIMESKVGKVISKAINDYTHHNKCGSNVGYIQDAVIEIMALFEHGPIEPAVKNPETEDPYAQSDLLEYMKHGGELTGKSISGSPVTYRMLQIGEGVGRWVVRSKNENGAVEDLEGMFINHLINDKLKIQEKPQLKLKDKMLNFIVKHDIRPSEFGLQAVNDAQLFDMIFNGEVLGSATVRDTRTYMRGYVK